MSSQLQALFKKFFGTPEYRLLIIGLDASGKTSILYRLKMGENIQTIPTIGFNVETVSYKNASFTMWDVGGCDKIRPLIRHYLQNTQGLICVVDSNDSQRLNELNEHLWHMLLEDEVRDAPLLVYLNKMDLPSGLKRDTIIQQLGLNNIRNRPWILQRCSAKTGDGLYEGLDWLVGVLKNPKKTVKPILQESNPEEEKTITWLSQIDEESDNEFLHQFEKHELSKTTFDHRTLLRAIWTSLKTHGRQETVKHIFGHLTIYFHQMNETWIYFWIQIVHYSMMAMRNQVDDFIHFLVLNPQLLNENDLPLVYYKQETLFSNEAKLHVVLPDRKPLPCIIPSTNHPVASQSQVLERPPDIVIEDDDEFIQQFESCTLTNWSHKTHLRMAWLYLTRDGRRTGVKKIFDGIKNFIDKSPVARKTTFHFTMTYFWIQMIDLAIAQSPSNISFEEFLQINPHLLNGGLFLTYYKKETMLNNPIARQEMVLPDIKPLPTLVPSNTRK